LNDVADGAVAQPPERAGSTHQHDGVRDFKHLTFFVLSRDQANFLYRDAVQREYDRPLRAGGRRKLGNLAVYVSAREMAPFRNGWQQIREHSTSTRPFEPTAEAIAESPPT
jgi:hypothetical protein